MSWVIVLQLSILFIVAGLVVNLVGESLIATWQKRDGK